MRAWSSACDMISAVMPLILMSICRAVMPCFGSGHFEVHVTQVVFETLDVGQDCITGVIVFFDQSHGNTGDRGFDRHAGIHQRQG